eukprot:CAMPEP_0197038032 /NCGR_PEP_ID=MMETSP1384-20130603/15083_1 /TAXON_ID=29189 /ORGANISM="Ammonia sp." /LENGTH=1212 /DNA_ID=CAMNT_0042468423 /DNA_START=30 /DNA_END=3668 /DNA_ORIENTATION=-
MNKITVNGKVKKLPQHLLKKKNNFQKKKKVKKGKKTQHVKGKTISTAIPDAQLIAKENYSITNENDDSYASSDTSAEWFNGDEDSDSKAYGQGGYLRVRIGDRLHNRYIIEQKLGWGHFSTVWLATDLMAPQTSHRRFVALKIQKSAPHYLDAAKDEVQLLNAAKQSNSKQDAYENYIVQMLDSFIVSANNGKHVVFVFEVLGENLLDLIKSYNYRGLPMAVVKKIAREVLLGLDYLHTQCDIIHTDLKPENVLISRTVPIHMQHLERTKNRELKKQYERQLKRFEQQMENNNVSKHLSKNQRKKLRQKVNELKKNISNIDKQYIVLLRDECKEDSDDVHHHHLDNADDDKNDKKKPLKAQFEFIHGRYILPDHHENAGKLIEAASPKLISPIAKICDLGNACWIDKHFTDDITTRQYRAPESILQVGYDTKVDIWSHACMIFELITGDYLFDPREKEITKDDAGYSRDEDHLALIGELCGKTNPYTHEEYTPWPKKWTLTNDPRFQRQASDPFDIYVKKIRANIKRPGLVGSFFGGYKVLKRDDRETKWDFTKHGYQLSNIPKLDFWSLAAVLEEKYKIPNQKRSKKECKNATRGHEEARPGSLAHFLGRMLEVDPSKRATAKEMLTHPWLIITKQDIEQCYKAECKWFKAKGKPTTDTNSHYGVSGNHAKHKNDDDDSSSSQSITDDDEEDDDDEDEVSKDSVDDEEEDDDDEDSEDVLGNASRSRDSSVDARDEFANVRSRSEPPVTWHKYIGIPWYEQFEEIMPTEHEEEEEELRYQRQLEPEMKQQANGLPATRVVAPQMVNGNGYYMEEEHHNGHGHGLGRNHLGKKQHTNIQYDSDDEDEDEDPYSMDPHYDPYADHDGDDSSHDNDDDDSEDDKEQPVQRKVTIPKIAEAEEEEDEEENEDDNEYSGLPYNPAFAAAAFTRYDNQDEDGPMVENEIFAEHAPRSSMIIHADGAGDNNVFSMEELRMVADEIVNEEEMALNHHKQKARTRRNQMDDNSEEVDDEDEEEEDEEDEELEEPEAKQQHQTFDGKHRQKKKFLTNPNVQPFFTENNDIKLFDNDKKYVNNLTKFNNLARLNRANYSNDSEPNSDPNNHNHGNLNIVINSHPNNNNNNNSSNHLGVYNNFTPILHEDSPDGIHPNLAKYDFEEIDGINEVGDDIASLPRFPANGQKNRNGVNGHSSQSSLISISSSIGSHSRESSTYDID